jgi:predicted nucleic acid-binding Zn ribbon protein
MSAGVGFVLKGSGFYQNDYKNPSKAPAKAAAPEAHASGCGCCSEKSSCPSAAQN